MATGFLDRVLGAGEGGADGSAEAFAEADADGVEVLGPFGFGDAGGGGGVPEASAVEMTPQAGLMRPFADRDDIFMRLNLASAAVVRVFEADEAGSDEVVVFGPNEAEELIAVQQAGFAFDGFGDDAAELRESALLVVVDVAAGLAQKFVAGLTVNADANLIG